MENILHAIGNIIYPVLNVLPWILLVSAIVFINSTFNIIGSMINKRKTGHFNKNHKKSIFLFFASAIVVILSLIGLACGFATTIIFDFFASMGTI